MVESSQNVEHGRDSREDSDKKRYLEKYIAEIRRTGQYLTVRQFLDCMNMPYIHENWQIAQLEDALRALQSAIKEILFIRARGGSKTNDTMKLCLYLSYLGFDGLYYTANASQLERPKIYMKDLIQRSYLKWCINELKKESFTFKGYGSLNLLNLTENKALSPRADYIVFDEERKADRDAYNNTMGIFADTDMALTIHISTAEKATVFEDNYWTLKEREKEDNKQYVFERKIYDISFLWDKHRARYEALKKKLPAWFWRQEYECSFELPMGAVFQNVRYESYPRPLRTPLCGGLDWNPVSGHWLVQMRWTEDMRNIVVEREHDVGTGHVADLSENQFWIIARAGSLGERLVMESGGINDEYRAWFNKKMDETRFGFENQQMNWEEWDVQGLNKLKVITMIIQNGITIWVDKRRFPTLTQMIRDCAWDPKSPEPKIKKDPSASPHALDAFLHALSKKNLDESQVEITKWY